MRIDADTDRHYERVSGLMMSLPNDDVRATMELNINNEEVFPEAYEIKLLTSSTQVAPDERFYTLNSQAKGSRIELKYQDSGSSREYPYRAILYLRLENTTASND